MDPDEFNQRLSQISTQWTAVIQAHQGSATTAANTRTELLQQYAGAVYRYLLGAVRDPDAAQELSHEFVVRFLRGDFHRANPDRGRFRDYLKTALINLVNDHFRSQQKRPRTLEAVVAEAATPANDGVTTSQDFTDCLREELLERTWAVLAQARLNYYNVLRLRVENPEMPAREMARQLSGQLDKQITADTVRKTLERARVKFADLLVAEVAMTMETTSVESLEAEMRELNLSRYCQSALERRKS